MQSILAKPDALPYMEKQIELLLEMSDSVDESLLSVRLSEALECVQRRLAQKGAGRSGSHKD